MLYCQFTDNLLMLSRACKDQDHLVFAIAIAIGTSTPRYHAQNGTGICLYMQATPKPLASDLHEVAGVLRLEQ